MNISFAWTLEPLLAGKKICTRRAWAERYYQRWRKAWQEGRRIHTATNKSARAGGKRIGTIELTCEPYREMLVDMPESDLDAEGGLWASKEEFAELFEGRTDRPVVVRFQFTPYAGLLEEGNDG